MHRRRIAFTLTDKDEKMNPRNTERFLHMLGESEPVFEVNLKKVELVGSKTRTEAEKYFREKYDHLKAFLRAAIDREECIKCSL